MKNVLIIILASGLAGAAFLTRPDREEFERYVRERSTSKSGNPIESIFKKDEVRETLDNVQFKDFYLWTVITKDGKTLYTGVFDRWVDNEKVRQSLPS
jgi:hypothetical protein